MKSCDRESALIWRIFAVFVVEISRRRGQNLPAAGLENSRRRAHVRVRFAGLGKSLVATLDNSLPVALDFPGLFSNFIGDTF